MPAAGERYNDRDLTSPFEGIDALAAVCLPAPYAVVFRTREPVEEFAEEFYSFDAALRFFAESRLLGFVDKFEPRVPLTPAQRARLGSAVL